MSPYKKYGEAARQISIWSIYIGFWSAVLGSESWLTVMVLLFTMSFTTYTIMVAYEFWRLAAEGREARREAQRELDKANRELNELSNRYDKALAEYKRSVVVRDFVQNEYRGITDDAVRLPVRDEIGFQLGVQAYSRSGWSINPVPCPLPPAFANGEFVFPELEDENPTFYWNHIHGFGVCFSHMLQSHDEGFYTARQIVNALYLHHDINRDELWSEVDSIEFRLAMIEREEQEMRHDSEGDD